MLILTMQGKRTQVVKEILETEHSYCTQLAAIVTLYLRPFKENTPRTTRGLNFLKKEPILDGEQRKTLFSGNVA
jgi:hypothetical protein